MSDESQVQNTETDFVPEGYMRAANGGLLKKGNPGNAGGGSIKKSIRVKLTDIIESVGIKAVESTIKDGTRSEQMKAVDVALKYGLGEPKVFSDDEIIKHLMDIAFEMFDSEVATKLIETLDERLRAVA